MADFFIKLKEFCKKVQTDSKRNISICLVGITLILLAIMPGSPASAPAVNSMRSNIQRQESSNAGFYEGPVKLPPREALRDPFAVPQDFAATRQDRLPARLAPGKGAEQLTATVTSQGKSQVNGKMPVLTGILADGKTQVAIICYNGVSRSYHIGQKIGQYQLIGINEKTVIVLGPQGEQVLLLGR
jgi:hypothetical protein